MGMRSAKKKPLTKKVRAERRIKRKEKRARASGFKFDPSQDGLGKTLKGWEELALRHMWDVGEDGAICRAVWERVNEGLGESKSISWASIILFLRRMERQGVLGSGDTTGKRGHYKVYYPLMDEREYRIHMIKTMVESMMRDFPEENTRSP